MPYRQHVYNNTTLSVVTRTVGDPAALEGALRRLSHERSPDIPITFTTLEDDASESMAAPRFRTLLLEFLRDSLSPWRWPASTA